MASGRPPPAMPRTPGRHRGILAQTTMRNLAVPRRRSSGDRASTPLPRCVSRPSLVLMRENGAEIHRKNKVSIRRRRHPTSGDLGGRTRHYSDNQRRAWEALGGGDVVSGKPASLNTHSRWRTGGGMLLHRLPRWNHGRRGSALPRPPASAIYPIWTAAPSFQGSAPHRCTDRGPSHVHADVGGAAGAQGFAIASACDENRRPDLLQNSQLDFQSRHVTAFLATAPCILAARGVKGSDLGGYGSQCGEANSILHGESVDNLLRNLSSVLPPRSGRIHSPVQSAIAENPIISKRMNREGGVDEEMGHTTYEEGGIKG